MTTYLYGLDLQNFTMRELSTSDLAQARHRIRDQFALLLVVYVVGSAVVAVLLRQFGLDAQLVALVVALAVVQHIGMELYRILTRLGRPVGGAIVLLVRDAAWVPLCFASKLVSGELSLNALLICWLAGSVAAVVYGASSLVRWLPPSPARRIDTAWLAAGVRTGLRMLPGTLAVVALFSVDKMILAALVTADQLGAYALFALGCASVQGLFETAILTSYWPPLLQAVQDGDEAAGREAQRRLTRVCLLGAIGGGSVMAGGLTVLAWLLPHPAYWANLHLLYYIVAAYVFLALTNIPHYRLYAARRDGLIVTADLVAFATFLVLAGVIMTFDRSLAVPLALALACACLLTIKSVMARRPVGPART
jgi:hypothetical protein